MLPRLSRGEQASVRRRAAAAPPLQASGSCLGHLKLVFIRTHVAGLAAPRASAPQHHRAARLHVAAAAASDAGTWGEGAGEAAGASPSSGPRAPPAGFASLERIIATNMGGGPGGDWKEVEVCPFLLLAGVAAAGARLLLRCLICAAPDGGRASAAPAAVAAATAAAAAAVCRRRPLLLLLASTSRNAPRLWPRAVQGWAASCATRPRLPALASPPDRSQAAEMHRAIIVMQGCFVLYPPEGAGEPRCLVHFIGGSFVGAAPQLAYRPLLEALAARGALVSAPWLPQRAKQLPVAAGLLPAGRGACRSWHAYVLPTAALQPRRVLCVRAAPSLQGRSCSSSGSN